VAALALAVASLSATSTVVLDAAASRESAADRFAGALRAQQLAPWHVDALPLVAASALDSRDPELVAAAVVELERRRWLRPHSASLADLRSRLAVAQARIPSAVAEAWAAQRANPANPVYGRRLSGLLDRLQEGEDAPGH
jgi:hypothetical protein